MDIVSSNDFGVRKSKSPRHERPEDLLRRLAWTFLLSSDDRGRNELLVKRLIKSVALVFASITGVAGSVALIYALWRYMKNRGNKGNSEKKSRRVCVVGAGIAGTSPCSHSFIPIEKNNCTLKTKVLQLRGHSNARDSQLRYMKRKITLVVTQNRIRGK